MWRQVYKWLLIYLLRWMGYWFDEMGSCGSFGTVFRVANDCNGVVCWFGIARGAIVHLVALSFDYGLESFRYLAGALAVWYSLSSVGSGKFTCCTEYCDGQAPIGLGNHCVACVVAADGDGD
uniref:Uncharacterized protein n=1 Tax=mine drainage metagenome TaxID=410659 RepID=E6QXG0_9ZZZZ